MNTNSFFQWLKKDCVMLVRQVVWQVVWQKTKIWFIFCLQHKMFSQLIMTDIILPNFAQIISTDILKKSSKLFPSNDVLTQSIVTIIWAFWNNMF